MIRCLGCGVARGATGPADAQTLTPFKYAR